MFNSVNFTRLLHVFCWLLLFSMVLFFANMTTSASSLSRQLFDGPHFLFYVVFPLIFYLNLGWLFPRWFLHKKYLLYFSTMLLLFITIFYLAPFDTLMRSARGGFNPGRGAAFEMPPPAQQSTAEPPLSQQPPPGPRFQGDTTFRQMPRPEAQNPQGQFVPGSGAARRPNIDIMSVILFILTWSVSTGLGVFRQWRTMEQRAFKAEADKAKAELSFLKAQVNPHFLFNTLNNIYSMAVTKNPATAESIMKLSNIMRYITDEVTENFVGLEDEINCLRDYIDLQRIRLGATTTVNFTVEGEPYNKKIAPLLLMTFVENAFKYGTSNHEIATINVFISVSEKTLRFVCKNKMFVTRRDPERTGIGISNAKQRLSSLYPESYLLDIREDAESYTVDLELKNV